MEAIAGMDIADAVRPRAAGRPTNSHVIRRPDPVEVDYDAMRVSIYGERRSDRSKTKEDGRSND